jgi:hypothetical protein
MEAKAIFIMNLEEIERAAEMGLKPPKPKRQADTLLFRLEDIALAYMSVDGDINVKLSDGDVWSLEYSDDLWNAIKNELENDKGNFVQVDSGASVA